MIEIKYKELTEYLKTLCYADFEDDTRKTHIQKAYTNKELELGMNPEKLKKQKFIAYGEPYLVDVIGCDLSVVWSSKKKHKLKTSCGTRSLNLKFDRTLLQNFGFVVNGYWAIPERFIVDYEKEVLVMIGKSQWFFGGNDPMCINIKNLSHLLKISEYKVRKIAKKLKEQNLIELVCRNMSTDEETYPPYWGYQPTKHCYENNEIMIKSVRDYNESLKTT